MDAMHVWNVIWPYLVGTIYVFGFPLVFFYRIEKIERKAKALTERIEKLEAKLRRPGDLD